ncbi:MAG: XdhC family protein, partial [Flavobacteriales bacterium]|nr:XdhC family protein [Flavobacteriales bacterium]
MGASRRSLNTAVNNVSGTWGTVLPALKAREHGVLLVVTASQGSSPGRAGFKMFVTDTGRMHGSIGGGSMEHKLVELARSLMDRAEVFPFLKRQIHREGEARDRSGMICSGEQSVAFFRIGPADGAWVRAMAECTDAQATIVFGQQGIRFLPGSVAQATGGDEQVWFSERVSSQPRVVIVGGGHVGLALTRTMNLLGFHVVQFDHRDGLEMMTANEWA